MDDSQSHYNLVKEYMAAHEGIILHTMKQKLTLPMRKLKGLTRELKKLGTLPQGQYVLKYRLKCLKLST